MLLTVGLRGRFEEVVLKDATRNTSDDEDEQSSYVPSVKERRRRFRGQNGVSTHKGHAPLCVCIVCRHRGRNARDRLHTRGDLRGDTRGDLRCDELDSAQLPTPGKYASRRRGAYGSKLVWNEGEGEGGGGAPAPLSIEIPGDQTTRRKVVAVPSPPSPALSLASPFPLSFARSVIPLLYRPSLSSLGTKARN